MPEPGQYTPLFSRRGAGLLSQPSNAITTRALGGLLSGYYAAKDYPEGIIGLISDIIKGAPEAVAGEIRGAMEEAPGTVYGTNRGEKNTALGLGLLGGTGTLSMAGLGAPRGALGMGSGRLKTKGMGQGNTFLDDVARVGFDDAVGLRHKYFTDKKADAAALLQKAQDPLSRVAGIKPTYGGEFGGSKTIPLEQIEAYDKGLLVRDHPLADMTPRKALKPADMEGRVMTALAGDQMRVGVVDRVLGKDVGGIEAKGGGENARFGAGWQSADSKMQRLKGIFEEYADQEVLGGFIPMGGASSDFQVSTGQLLSKMADPTQVTKKEAKVLDQIINPKNKKGEPKFKDYPGIKSDEFLPWFLSRANTSRSGIIKSLTKTPADLRDDMPKGKVPYEIIPGLDIPGARHALTEPGLLNRIAHPTDPSISKVNYFDKNTPIIDTAELDVPHESFPRAARGGAFGELPNEPEIPMSLIFDDYFSGAAGLTKPGQRPLQNSAAGAVAQNMTMGDLVEPRAVITPEKVGLLDDYLSAWKRFSN